jgi:ATP-dependent Lon protease
MDTAKLKKFSQFARRSLIDQVSGRIKIVGRIQESCATVGIDFTWEFDGTCTIHARHIVTDTGWKILLDRGLDIFQHYDIKDAFSIANRLQEFRGCKAFEVTFLRRETKEFKPF